MLHPPRQGVAVGFAALTVLLQIAYPLTSGQPRDLLTITTVTAFLLATLSHAHTTRGTAWTTAYLVIAAGTGAAAEVVGTRTGLPFGDYAYADSLGWRVLDVPVVVPMAWAMFAYPCLLLGQRLCRSGAAAAATGAGALAGWDVFLDPQMVEAGHWRWLDVQHSLPGEPDVPVSNHLGWLLVGVMLMSALQALPRVRADDRLPAALLLWTWASSALAFAVFFGRPLTGLVGALALGATALPYAVVLLREARSGEPERTVEARTTGPRGCPSRASSRKVTT